MVKPLVVKNLSKNFAGLQALLDVSFSVEAGERLVILGPNGSGKTTMFNLITGVLRPSAGSVCLFNEEITHMPAHRRVHLGIARTFQITNLFPNLTLHENIFLALLGIKHLGYMRRLATSCEDILSKTEKLIADWQLEEYRHTLVQNLSYGTQRQVEVILALASEAKVLLLDEPSAGLSPAETSELTSMILGLDPNMTIIIIEHDIDVAFQLAYKMIVLHYGKLVASGSPEKIKADPKVKEIYLGED